jgi:hypothetical protein
VLGITTLFAQNAIPPAEGLGTEDDPYQIASLENLYWFAASNDIIPYPNQESRWSSHYIQIADIDATDTENWFDGEGWNPIGFYEWSNPNNLPFTGVFNGQDHTIDAIFINRPNTRYIGLFGYTYGSTIENLRITNIDISGYGYVGGIVGRQDNNSTVSNSLSTGSVNGNYTVGGLVGEQGNNSTISNSYSNGNVNGHSEYVGGLLGYQSVDSTIIDSYSTASVYGVRSAGGLVGSQWGATITDSYSTGSVNGDNVVGGLIGKQYISTISNSYSTGNVCGEVLVGGLVGHNDTSSISNSYSMGCVSGNERVGGLVGQHWTTTIINSYYNYEEVLINDQNVITIGALGSEIFNTWLDNDLYLNIDDYLSYDGNSYLINSVNDFKKLLAFGQFEEYSYKLTTDLDLEDYPNFYIPYFSGSFDGDGFIIDKLTLNIDFLSFIGLFGYTFESIIENLGVSNVDITGDRYVGGIAGIQRSSIISNSYSSGSTSGSWSVSGIVGDQWGSTIANCFSIGGVNGEEYVGGLVGRQFDNSTIINSFSMGSVNGPWYVGGLVGRQESSNISNSYSTRSVSGDTHVGGLIGAGDGNANNSYWDIETSGQTTSASGEGRTTEEMTYPYADNTYVNWDFDEIWAVDEDYTVNNGYPYLQDTPHVSAEDDLVIFQPDVDIYNYPNPFNPSTTIEFSLSHCGYVTIEIFNIRGQKVKTLVNEEMLSGEHRIIWNGKDDKGRQLPSGIYLYKLATDYEVVTRKMMLLK